jgi:hypothetical protein
MKAFSVHAPPDEPSAAERFAFVKDGFSWPALFLPILWILWHRMWLTLMGYIIFALLLAWTERLTSENIATVLALLGAVLFALEANHIRRLSLARRGWQEIGGATGRDLDEAEIRFFGAWTKDGARSRPMRAAPASDDDAPAYPDRDEPIFGLFPEPER